MKSNLATIIFAVVMGVVCALVLTAVAEFVKPWRLDNEQAERYSNVLHIFDIPIPPGADNEQIVKLFEQKVETVGKDSENPDYYQYTITAKDGSKQTYVALPAQGPGLWGPIEGLIGLAPDGATITAVSFYKQEETPGLGGEIATQAFTDRFKDKRLFDPDGRPALQLVKPGTAQGDFQIDAISGATMTSEKVQSLITTAARNFSASATKESR